MSASRTADLVIVGGSLGGLRTAEAARKAGFDGSILVVGDEPYLPYNRPPLSKSALVKGESATSLAFPLRDSLEEIEWMLGSSATNADLARSRVVLSSGGEVSYSHLVIATGRRPRRLPFEAEQARRHVVYTVDDSERLRSATANGERVVIIGGGFIGCETAASLASRGCSVTLVCSGELPLLRPLGRDLARALTNRHRAEGVTIVTSTTVIGVRAGASATIIELDDGRSLEADVVVEAVGSEPAVEWLTDSDVILNDGVTTDARLRARRAKGGVWASVWAVGDVARFPHQLAPGAYVAIPHWSTPGDTARTVGAAIAAVRAGIDPRTVPPFTALPTFWSDQYTLHIRSYGLPALGSSTTVLEGAIDGECVIGYLRDNVLVGTVGVGMRAQLNATRELIGGRLPTPLGRGNPNRDGQE